MSVGDVGPTTVWEEQQGKERGNEKQTEKRAVGYGRREREKGEIGGNAKLAEEGGKEGKKEGKGSKGGKQKGK